MWFMEEPSQFSVGQIAQSLTCSIMEKPHTGLDHYLRMLLSCFRKRTSERESDWLGGREFWNGPRKRRWLCRCHNLRASPHVFQKKQMYACLCINSSVRQQVQRFQNWDAPVLWFEPGVIKCSEKVAKWKGIIIALNSKRHHLKLKMQKRSDFT